MFVGKICSDCGHGKIKKHCNICNGCIHKKRKDKCNLCKGMHINIQ